VEQRQLFDQMDQRQLFDQVDQRQLFDQVDQRQLNDQMNQRQLNDQMNQRQLNQIVRYGLLTRQMMQMLLLFFSQRFDLSTWFSIECLLIMMRRY